MSASSVIANAQVAVGANLSGFNAAMDQLKWRAKRDVKAAMAAIQDEMQKTQLQINLGMGAGQVQAVQLLNDYMVHLNAQMDLAKAKAIGMAQQMSAVGSSMGKLKSAAAGAGGGFRNFGYGVLMLSQALEDAQYGFSAVVNNIPGIAMAFGLGPGVAGALSVAAIAVNQLIKYWDVLTNAFGMGKVKTQAEQMEELSKKTAKTADETARLAKYERERKSVEQQDTGSTKQQSEQSEGVNKAIVEGPAKNVDELIKDIVRQKVTNASPEKVQLDEIQKVLKDPPRKMVAGTDRGSLEQKQKDLTAAIETKVEEESKRLRAEITENPKALLSLIDKLKARGNVSQKLIKELTDAAKTPEQREAEKDQADADQEAMDANTKSAEYFEKQRERERDQKVQLQKQEEDAAEEKARKRTDDARRQIDLAGQHDPLGLNKGEIGRLQREHDEASKDEWETYRKGSERRRAETEAMPADAPERRERELQEEGRRRAATSRADQSKDYGDRLLEKRSQAAGRGLEEKLRYDILASVAKGQDVDKDKLQGKVSADMKASGKYTDEDIKEMAPEIVKQLMNQTMAQVQERGNREGISDRDAAREEVAQKVAQNRKERGQGGFTGVTDFYKKLQGLQDAKDPYQALIEGHSKRTADAIEQVLKEITIRRKRDGGGLVGPA